MPTIPIGPAQEMQYVVDDYTDPWQSPETILLVHGIHDRGQVWYGWVPHLARQYRVVRPDMRGFGDSTPMPPDYPWSVDGIIDDYMALMRHLGVVRFHLVGAKIGGTVVRRFAARHPENVLTLTVVGAPPPKYRERKATDTDGKAGIDNWTAGTMGLRLGSKFPPEAVTWWGAMMAKTPASTLMGFRGAIPTTDISADLPRIQCPTLVICSPGRLPHSNASGPGPVEITREWQRLIPNSTLVEIPSDSYHISATECDRCAGETLAFICRHRQPV